MSLRDISTADYGSLLLVVLIWSGNFALIKIGLDEITPFVMTFIRFSLCVFPFVFFIPKPRIPTHVLMSYGILFGGGVWGSANIAIYTGMSPGAAALLIQLSAFITFIIGIILFQEKASKISIIALMISLSGLLLMLIKNDGYSGLPGIGLCLFSAFCFSLCNILIQKHKPKDLISFMTWSSLFGLPVLFILALFFEGTDSFYNLGNSINYKTIISLIWQSYITTLLGYWIWNHNIRKYSASAVAPIGLLIPFFAIIISFLFFDYQITGLGLLSMGLVFFGVILFNLKSKVKRVLKVQ